MAEQTHQRRGHTERCWSAEQRPGQGQKEQLCHLILAVLNRHVQRGLSVIVRMIHLCCFTKLCHWHTYSGWGEVSQGKHLAKFLKMAQNFFAKFIDVKRNGTKVEGDHRNICFTRVFLSRISITLHLKMTEENFFFNLMGAGSLNIAILQKTHEFFLKNPGNKSQEFFSHFCKQIFCGLNHLLYLTKG